MESLIQNIIEVLQQVVQNSNYFISIFAGMFIIILESMIPMLPLALFIAINMLVFGNIIGFLISWIATVIGCSLSFLFFRCIKKGIGSSHKTSPSYWLTRIGKIPFSHLVMILSIPFTPAFSVNIGAGLSNIKYTKYLIALLISKIFLIYFWGFIGTTLIESITDIGILFKLCSMVFASFLLSKWAMHKLNFQ